MDPMLSKALLAAEKYKCTDEIVSIVSMLSVQNAVIKNLILGIEYFHN